MRFYTYNGRQPYTPTETGTLPETGRFYAIEPDGSLTVNPEPVPDDEPQRGGWLARVATNTLPPVAHGSRAFVR